MGEEVDAVMFVSVRFGRSGFLNFRLSIGVARDALLFVFVCVCVALLVCLWEVVEVVEEACLCDV